MISLRRARRGQAGNALESPSDNTPNSKDKIKTIGVFRLGIWFPLPLIVLVDTLHRPFRRHSRSHSLFACKARGGGCRGPRLDVFDYIQTCHRRRLWIIATTQAPAEFCRLRPFSQAKHQLLIDGKMGVTPNRGRASDVFEPGEPVQAIAAVRRGPTAADIDEAVQSGAACFRKRPVGREPRPPIDAS